ncbi:MAG: hypothetical protein CVU71_16550 [Deltaproteobacteria bacterium HGW-Deltaproteobacteria-6]|jgi:hypothetical protein|nr:MAG: hypothetical protein CVU71_16550 [Deltaproteobacteria bacterium HGW-Deltaproteobacteria-6]
MKLKYTMILALIALMGFSGCSPEPRSVTMHEPGVYKGVQDPVLVQNQQQELINRLKLVQTDR